jgi:hypothetical protein
MAASFGSGSGNGNGGASVGVAGVDQQCTHGGTSVQMFATDYHRCGAKAAGRALQALPPPMHARVMRCNLPPAAQSANIAA